MLVDIDPNKKMPEYTLVLHKLTGEPIQELWNITQLEYKAFFVGMDELSFEVPYYRDDAGELVPNEIYPLVDGDHLISVNDEQFFTIVSVVESADAKGKTVKKVKAFSKEYELGRKKLVNYKADSRMIYTTNNITDDDGLEVGIMNYILNHITMGWSIGYVDPEVVMRSEKNVYRALNFADTNLLQVFQNLQEVFNCIFKFDTLKNTIDIYDFEKLKGRNQGLYISDHNFIQSINKTIDYDKIKTRLYLYGKDNISIQSIAPTGQPYIDNFDVFKSEKYMTRELIDALDNYEKLVEDTAPNFIPLRERLTALSEELKELIDGDGEELGQKGQVALSRALTLIQSQIDVQIEAKAIKQEAITKVENNNSLEELHKDLQAIQDKINLYQENKRDIESFIDIVDEKIIVKQAEVADVRTEISELQKLTDPSSESNFTPELVKELDKFIRVATFHSAEYEEHSLDELYEEGRRELNRISQRPITFSANVIDFLSVVECQHTWDRFILGDAVTIEHEELGFNEEVRLIGYTHQVDGAKLSLQFSNLDSIDDATLYLRDLLEGFKTTATSVNFNKYKWDKAENLESEISSLIDTKLENSRQDILNAVGQKHLFDDSGLWLYRERANGKKDPEQIRAINNTIALTKDNWKSINTAITPDGIIAEHVYGKLGAFARISTEQIEIGGYEGDESDKPINNLQSTLDKQWDELRAHEEELGKTLKEDTPYNNVLINKRHGFVAGDGTGNTIVSMNATDGIKIQTKKDNIWKDSFFVDRKGNLNLSGNITLSGGFIDWENVNKPIIPPQYDKDNVLEDIEDILIEKTYIDANGIWTPGVYANTIDVTKGKIKTAQIEDLIVGGNVTMGADSKITWNNLPADLDSKTKLTEITKNTISTEYIKGLKLEVGTHIQMAPNAKIQWGNMPAELDSEIKLTNITKDTISTEYIKGLKLTVGNEILMGSGAVIRWDNLNAASKANLKGEKGDVGQQGPQGETGAAGSDAQVPSYIKSTYIDFSEVRSPKISGNFMNAGIMTGGVIQTAGSGRRITLNEGGDIGHGNNSLRIYATNGFIAGALDYDTGGAGSAVEARERIFLRSASGHALKLQSGSDMSISSHGTTYISGRLHLAGASITGLTAVFG